MRNWEHPSPLHLAEKSITFAVRKWEYCIQAIR